MLTSETLPKFSVKQYDWPLLEDAAAEAGSTPDQFVEDAIRITSLALEAFLSNLNTGKLITCLLFQRTDGSYEQADIEYLIRTAHIKEGDREIIGITDPFIDDASVSLDLSPDLESEIAAICDTLGVNPVGFMQLAIDLRWQLQLAHRRDLEVLLETQEQGEYYDLTSSLYDEYL